jgi:hypothetical protein
MTHTIQISSTKHLGAVVRATRKWQKLRQDEVGRFSHTFIGELESGKPTAQLGKVLEALRELGIHVKVELPPGMSLPPLAEQRGER